MRLSRECDAAEDGRVAIFSNPRGKRRLVNIPFNPLSCPSMLFFDVDLSTYWYHRCIISLHASGQWYMSTSGTDGSSLSIIDHQWLCALFQLAFCLFTEVEIYKRWVVNWKSALESYRALNTWLCHYSGRTSRILPQSVWNWNKPVRSLLVVVLGSSMIYRSFDLERKRTSSTKPSKPYGQRAGIG